MSTTPKLAAMTLALALAPAARALAPAYDYTTVRAGAFLPQGSSYRSFDTGPDFQLAVGRAFLPYVAGELSVGYASAESDVRSARYHGNDPTYPAFDLREGYQLVPVTVTVKLMLPSGSVEPWVGGGAGLAWTRIHEDPVNDLPTVSESSTVFTYHAGGGVTVQLAKRWYGGVDFRYAFVKARWFNDGMVTLNGVRLTAAFGTRF